MTESRETLAGWIDRSLAAAVPDDAGNSDAAPPRRYLIEGPTPLTYGDLATSLPRLAGLFAALGLAIGDRLLLSSRDDAATCRLYLAAVRCGLAAVVVDPRLPPTQAAPVLSLCRPRAAVVDVDHPALAACLEAIGTARISTIGSRRSLKQRLLGRGRAAGTDLDRRLQDCTGAALPREVAPTATAHILLTSGSTGDSKAVVLTHANLACHLRTLIRHFGYGRDVRILNHLPMHHTDGLTQGLLPALLTGGTVVRGPDLRQGVGPLLELVRSAAVTHLYTTPSVLRAMLRHGQAAAEAFRGPGFRFVLSSGEELPQTTWREFEERFATTIVNVYGLTETVSGSLYSGPDAASRRVGSLGRPVDCAARVCDARSREVPTGTVGELQLCGPHLSPGYLTADGGIAPIASDGWFATGDLVVAADDGSYRLVGRKKNLVIVAGENVAPERVERCLGAAAGVLETAAVGVDDPLTGERLVAYVVVVAGARQTREALIRHCREHLLPAEVPAALHLVAALPRTAGGKVDRVRLQESAKTSARAQERSPSPVAAAVAEVAEVVLAVAARCFQLDPGELTLAARSDATPGWDSFAHLELVVALEQQYGIRLGPSDIVRIRTLADAVAIVEELRPVT